MRLFDSFYAKEGKRGGEDCLLSACRSKRHISRRFPQTMPWKEHRRLRSLLPRPMLRQVLLDRQGEPSVVAQERGVEVDAIGWVGNAHRRARVRHEPFVGHAQRPREIGVEERERRVFADLFEPDPRDHARTHRGIVCDMRRYAD